MSKKHIRKIVHYRFWSVVSILLVSSLVILYANEELITSTNHPIIYSILNKTAVAILITGIFSVLNKFFLHINLIDLIHNKIR